MPGGPSVVVLAERAVVCTLDSLAPVRARSLGHHLGDRPVLVARLDRAHRGLGRGPCRAEDVRLAALDRLLCRGADDDGLRRDRRKAVDVRAKVDLDDVAVSEEEAGERVRATQRAKVRMRCEILGRVDARERRKVRDGVVDGDTCRERDAWDMVIS
jgi:hypothetical protein